MSQITFQSCSACETTAAQWARANASPHLKQDLSSPGTPYSIPPTFGSESHPYARQIGDTQIMAVPKPEAPKNKVPQKKVWVQPEYRVVVKKNVDMDHVKELISNILPPAPKPEDTAPMPPRPNVPTPPGVPPRYRLSVLQTEDAIPPPRPYVPGPPYERPSGFSTEGLLPNPRPNVPLTPDAHSTQSISGPTPRPNVPLPPDAPPNQ